MICQRFIRHATRIVACLLIFSLPALASESFHQLESATPLQSDHPDWDYLTFDPVTSYLYIGARNEGVIVYDVRAKKVVRNIDDAKGANATTLAHEFDRGYTTNTDGTSTIFQLSTLRVIGKIKLGESADAGFYDPVSKQVVFMRGDSKEMTFVDAKTGTIAARLAMASKKLEGTAPDGNGHIFTALRDRNAVIKVDMRSHQVVAEWPIAGCQEANGLAFDAVHKRIFVGCRGSRPVLAVLDSDNGRVISTHDIGRGNDGVIYDPQSKHIYVSCGVDGNLVIYKQVDADTYKLVEATTTRPYARTMALDPATKKVYLVTAEGTADPSRKINRGVAPFYPNRYFKGTMTLLTYSVR